MRPTALELIDGVRAMLAAEVLPAMTAPHLRAQVMLALGMLAAARAEIDAAPALYAEERARVTALAREALPLVQRLAPGHALAAALGEVAGAPEDAPPRRLSAQAEESARLLALLDRLAAFCDEQRDRQDAGLAALAARVDDELRAWTAARMAWIGGGA